MKKIFFMLAIILCCSCANAATITVTVPNAVLTRVLDAFANKYGYKAAGGQTKAEFARDRVIDFIKQTVKTSEDDTFNNSFTDVDLGVQ